MDYFIFKNIDSRNIPGLVINSLPPITKAAKRTEIIEIDGKDGDIIEEKGYKSYDKPLTITLMQDYDVNTLINWLNGSGKLILSNESDKYYEAEIVEQIDFERLFKYLPVKIIFHVQPYKYLVNENVSTIEAVESEEAEEIEVTDYAGGEGVLSITGGKTEQAQYEGKNLLDYISKIKASSNGLTNTINEDGSITTTGIPTSSWTTIITTYIINEILEDGKTYTISQSNINDNNLYVQIAIMPKDGGSTSYASCQGKTSSSFVVDKTKNNYSIMIQTGSASSWGETSKTYTTKYMLAKGTDTVFEKYVGGIVSPNPNYKQDVINVGCNANLLNITATSQTVNGVTFTVNSDGTVLANGIATSEINLILNNSFAVEENKKYTLSGCPVGGSATTYLLRSTDNIWNENHYDMGDGITFIPINPNIQRVVIQIKSGATLNNILFKPKLEKGSKATGYSKYGCGSIDFLVRNKNLFNINNITNGARLGTNGQSYSGDEVSQNFFISEYVPVNENEKYTLNFYLQATKSVCYYDASKNFISRNISQNPFTIPANTKYIRFCSLQSEKNNIMLLKGEYSISNFPTYVEGKSQVVAVPLPEGMELCEVDYLHRVENKWYKHKAISKYVFTGTENLVDNSMNYVHGYSLLIDDMKSNVNNASLTKDLCTHFSQVSPNENWNSSANKKNFSISMDKKIRFTIGDTSNALNSFKNWLAAQYSNGTPIILSYELATPIEEEITDEDTIAALNQLEHLLLYEGYCLITCEDVVKPDIKLKYVSTNDATIENQGLEQSKPVLKIYGDGQGSIYKNGQEIFTINVDDEYVVIDSKEEEAYKEGFLKNRFMNGEFPILDPGENVISWGGNIEKVEVMPNSRWL